MSDYNSEYWTVEAVGVLARLRAQRRPEFYLGEKIEASNRLLGAFVGAVKVTKGYEVDTPPGGIVVACPRVGAVKLRIEDNTGKIEAAHHDAQDWAPAALEYDPVQKEWNGTEIDTNIAPKPGEPFPRKGALPVLAELVVSMMESE
jgi:hypothetical protein